MEKLGVFKVVDDVLECCGFFNSKEDALAYLVEVKKLIDNTLQNALAGEYIIVPTLYFKINVAGQPN
jgi:hypothetical protein